MSSVRLTVPCGAAPLACIRRSGITSRAKWASFSISQTSCNSAGPRGPAVWMLKLSVTGVPDAWARGGFLDSSFIRLLRLRLGRLATHYSLRGIEVAARRPPCCGVPVSQRRLPWPHLLTDVRSREPGRGTHIAIGLAITLALLLRLCRSCLNRPRCDRRLTSLQIHH